MHTEMRYKFFFLFGLAFQIFLLFILAKKTRKSSYQWFGENCVSSFAQYTQPPIEDSIFKFTNYLFQLSLLNSLSFFNKLIRQKYVEFKLICQINVHHNLQQIRYRPTRLGLLLIIFQQCVCVCVCVCVSERERERERDQFSLLIDRLLHLLPIYFPPRKHCRPMIQISMQIKSPFRYGVVLYITQQGISHASRPNPKVS